MREIRLDERFDPRLIKHIQENIQSFNICTEELSPENQKLLDNIIKLGAIFTPAVIVKNLAKLSTLIEARLKEKGLYTKEGIPFKEDKTYVSSYKVLTEILLEELIKNGFNQDGKIICNDSEGNKELVELPTCLPVIPTVVSAMDLRRVLLSQGYLWKDVGVTALHNDLTHILQLWIIANENEDKPFLDYDIRTLYTKMVSPPFTSVRNGSTFSLWDCVLDVDGGTFLNNAEGLNFQLLKQKYHPDNAVKADFYGIYEEINRESIGILFDIISGRAEKLANGIDLSQEIASSAGQSYLKKKPDILTIDRIIFPQKTDAGKKDYTVNDGRTEFNAARHQTLVLEEAPHTAELLNELKKINTIEEKIRYIFSATRIREVKNPNLNPRVARSLANSRANEAGILLNELKQRGWLDEDPNKPINRDAIFKYLNEAYLSFDDPRSDSPYVHIFDLLHSALTSMVEEDMQFASTYKNEHPKLSK